MSAANNIEAKSKSLRDLLKQKRYVVGYFQREYRWQRDNIEDLIVDLERSFFENYDVNHSQQDVANYNSYYMGPIVLFQEKAEFSIVDGQQRLSAFTLLLIFLNHKLDEILNQAGKLDEYIRSDYFGNVDLNLNIENRKKVISKLFKGETIEANDLEIESCRNLYDTYQSIVELFPKRLLMKDVLPMFTNWLTEKLIFIEIMAQSSDHAYTIFETMNDRGLRLTPTEMLKSYLLSKVEDEDKIKELDTAWKQKMGQLKSFSNDEDMVFFRAWLKAKHAVKIRIAEKGAKNEDFEKISTRFHNWIQDNAKRLLELKSADDYFYFVHSDIQFYSDLYLMLRGFENSSNIPEHRLKLISYRGVSPSLSYPFLMSPIEKVDDEEIISKKIQLCVKYLDAYGVYRMLSDEPVTHSSIRVSIYNLVKEIRNNNTEHLSQKLRALVNEQRNKFIHEAGYTKFIEGNAKYIYSRLYKENNPNVNFEDIYYQRKKDSFVLYQFLTFYDVEPVVHKIPKGLRQIMIESLCTCCVVPRTKVAGYDILPIVKRIEKLINDGYILEFNDFNKEFEDNLKDFFIKRSKKIKESIFNYWKV